MSNKSVLTIRYTFRPESDGFNYSREIIEERRYKSGMVRYYMNSNEHPEKFTPLPKYLMELWVKRDRLEREELS